MGNCRCCRYILVFSHLPHLFTYTTYNNQHRSNFSSLVSFTVTFNIISSLLLLCRGNLSETNDTVNNISLDYEKGNLNGQNNMEVEIGVLRNFLFLLPTLNAIQFSNGQLVSK